jgi:hypothetical protein
MSKESCRTGSMRGSRQRCGDEKNELVRKILQVCAACPHLKADAACDRKKSQCHSKRVRQWLKELERLEVNNEPDS